MQRIDSMNTTALDGRACELCGDDATGTDTIDNGHRTIPTCDHCHEYAIVTCDCGRRGLFHEFSRFTQPPPHKPILRCAMCASAILKPIYLDDKIMQQAWKDTMRQIRKAQKLLWSRTPIAVRQGLLMEIIDAQRKPTEPN